MPHYWIKYKSVKRIHKSAPVIKTEEPKELGFTVNDKRVSFLLESGRDDVITDMIKPPELNVIEIDTIKRYICKSLAEGYRTCRVYFNKGRVSIDDKRFRDYLDDVMEFIIKETKKTNWYTEISYDWCDYGPQYYVRVVFDGRWNRENYMVEDLLDRYEYLVSRNKRLQWNTDINLEKLHLSIFMQYYIKKVTYMLKLCTEFIWRYNFKR